MNIITYKVIFSLIFVIALMYIVLKLVQKYGKFGLKLSSSAMDMKIDGILYIDENTKIVSLRKTYTNYILAVNKNNTIVIDKYESDK